MSSLLCPRAAEKAGELGQKLLQGQVKLGAVLCAYEEKIPIKVFDSFYRF